MTFLNSYFLAQGVVDVFDQVAVSPAAEMIPNIPVGWEVMGQKPPGTAGAGLVENGIPDFAQGIFARSACASVFCLVRREPQGDPAGGQPDKSHVPGTKRWSNGNWGKLHRKRPFVLQGMETPGLRVLLG